MFCRSCGAEIAEDAKFCDRCGKATALSLRASRLQHLLWAAPVALIVGTIGWILLYHYPTGSRALRPHGPKTGGQGRFFRHGGVLFGMQSSSVESQALAERLSEALTRLVPRSSDFQGSRVQYRVGIQGPSLAMAFVSLSDGAANGTSLNAAVMSFQQRLWSETRRSVPDLELVKTELLGPFYNDPDDLPDRAIALFFRLRPAGSANVHIEYRDLRRWWMAARQGLAQARPGGPWCMASMGAGEWLFVEVPEGTSQELLRQQLRSVSTEIAVDIEENCLVRTLRK